MKKQEKKMIAYIIIIGLIIVAIIWFATRNKGDENSSTATQSTPKEEYTQVLTDGTKINTSSKLNQNKKLGDLEIGNIQFTYRNGVSVVLADVTNKGNSATSLKPVELTLLKKDGSTIEKLQGIIPALKPGATTQLNIGASSDVANAYDFVIIEK